MGVLNHTLEEAKTSLHLSESLCQHQEVELNELHLHLQEAVAQVRVTVLFNATFVCCNESYCGVVYIGDEATALLQSKELHSRFIRT